MAVDGTRGFPHERLDAWQAGLELACQARVLADGVPPALHWVGAEVLRTAGSVSLEVAAGASEWRSRRALKRFRRAQAAARRCAATAELALAMDATTPEQVARVRVAAVAADGACGRLLTR